MPTSFPKEFRDDIVRVALNRDSGVTLAQIAKDFGVHVGTLATWMRQARTEAGEQPGVTTSENQELRELRKRTRLLEQENEVLRRAAVYLSQANLPGMALPAVRLEVAGLGSAGRIGTGCSIC